jgi:phenylacetate-CoA ligase
MMMKSSDTYLRKVLYAIYQLKFGPTFGYRVLNILSDIHKTQWLSNEEIHDYQAWKLKRLITHAYNNVPYYKDLMLKSGLAPKDINSIEDIKRLPILTKQIIKETNSKIKSTDFKKRNVLEASTSGTTGTPLIYYRDANSRIWQEAAKLRGWLWARYKIGNTIVTSGSEQSPSLLGKIRLKFTNAYEYPTYAKENEIISYFRQIMKLNPFCLIGQASNLYRIAKLLEKNEVNGIHFPLIFSTAEMLYDYQREFLQNQFNSQVYDYYGCNEIGSLAYECEHKNKHITDEHVIMEVIDSRSNSVIGKPGELVITDLDNYAMPFIRYQLGDVGTVTNEKCTCGRGLNLLKHVDGRTQDFIKTLDGNYVSSIFFPSHFRGLKGIEQYQIIQSDLHKITLKVVKNQFFIGKELEDMICVIKEVIGDAVSITIEECDYILLTKHGKTRLVISHLPTEF